MKRENLIKRDDFWEESIREMQILHWQDSELTIKEILKLKNELINSFSGNTVKLVKDCLHKLDCYTYNKHKECVSNCPNFIERQAE